MISFHTGGSGDSGGDSVVVVEVAVVVVVAVVLSADGFVGEDVILLMDVVVVVAVLVVVPPLENANSLLFITLFLSFFSFFPFVMAGPFRGAGPHGLLPLKDFIVCSFRRINTPFAWYMRISFWFESLYGMRVRRWYW